MGFFFQLSALLWCAQASATHWCELDEGVHSHSPGCKREGISPFRWTMHFGRTPGYPRHQHCCQASRSIVPSLHWDYPRGRLDFPAPFLTILFVFESWGILRSPRPPDICFHPASRAALTSGLGSSRRGYTILYRHVKVLLLFRHEKDGATSGLRPSVGRPLLWVYLM